MIDILKRIFIGVAIGMSIFFIKSYCFALTWDLDYVGEKTNIWSSTKVITKSLDDTGSLWIPFDNTFTNSSGVNFAVIQITGLTFSDGSVSITDSILRFTMPSQQGASALCELQGSAIVCPIVKNYTYRGINVMWSINAALYDCAFTLKINNSVQYYRYHGDTEDSPAYKTYEETKKITDETDRSGNGDSFDDSGITSNNNKEDALTQDTESSINNFNIDLSGNANAFQYIFFLLDKFVKANAKIFGVVLSLLGFGFIRLVLGR